MLPSRGLRWSSQTIGIGRRRLELCSIRQFSSIVQNAPIKSNPLLSKNGASTARICYRYSFSRGNHLIRNGVGLRFASTTPISTSAAASTPSNALSSSAAPPPEVFASSLDNATDFSSESLYDIPEHIGYLKSLGLDFGNGPTACMEWLLEHVHVLAGTPWWVSIALTAVVVRAVLFKPYIDAADNASRLQAVKPLTDPLTRKMRENTADTAKVLEIRREIQIINRRAGIKIWKTFVPMSQAFAGYGMFVLLRAMAKVPVPGLESGGILWFYNLAVPDPFFILPLATAFLLHRLIKRGGETGAQTMSPQAVKVLSYAFPGISLICTAFMPAGLQLSFFVSSMLSGGQALLFKWPAFRTYWNMYPLPTREPDKSSPTPYPGTMRVRAPVLTTAELDRTYQSSRTSATETAEFRARKQALQDAKPPGKESGITRLVPGFVKEATKDISGAVDAAKDMMGQGRDRMAQRQAKSDKKAADAYELKRQREIREAKLEREESKRAERAYRASLKKR